MIVEDLYRQLIEAWNSRDAEAFAALFILDGEAVDSDGTQHTGRGAIVEQVRAIFATHDTPPFVTKIVGVTTVTTDVAIVRAIAGMVPRGTTELDPQLHSIQRLTAVFRGGDWRIALLQSTPARLEDPDDLTRLTTELQASRS